MAQYDPTKDVMQPVNPGEYPAHIVGVNDDPYQGKDKNGDDLRVYTVQYRIAEEAKEQIVPVLKRDEFLFATDDKGNFIIERDENGDQKSQSAEAFVGRVLEGPVFMYPNNPGKNRGYKDFLEAAGVKTEESNESGHTVYELPDELEEDLILGAPVFIRVTIDFWERRDGSQGQTPKVNNIFPWAAGDQLDPDEAKPEEANDLPF